MIANLERQEAELNDEIARLESDIENGAGDISELRRRIAELENQLKSTGQKLADLSTFGRFRRKNRDKLRLADRQFAELQNELDALSEKRDNAQSDEANIRSRQVRMRLTDAIFGRLVVDIRELFAAMPSKQKARVDGEFMTAIAERPNEILKCAMYLFLGYLDGATQYVSFASRSLANVGRRPVRGWRSRKLPTAIRPVMRRRW